MSVGDRKSASPVAEESPTLWKFFPGVDSPGFDLIRVDGGTSDEDLARLKEACLRHGGIAFNTSGWIKRRVSRNPKQFKRFSRQPENGLYVRLDAEGQLIVANQRFTVQRKSHIVDDERARSASGVDLAKKDQPLVPDSPYRKFSLMGIPTDLLVEVLFGVNATELCAMRRTCWRFGEAAFKSLQLPRVCYLNPGVLPMDLTEVCPKIERLVLWDALLAKKQLARPFSTPRWLFPDLRDNVLTMFPLRHIADSACAEHLRSLSLKDFKSAEISGARFPALHTLTVNDSAGRCRIDDLECFPSLTSLHLKHFHPWTALEILKRAPGGLRSLAIEAEFLREDVRDVICDRLKALESLRLLTQNHRPERAPGGLRNLAIEAELLREDVRDVICDRLKALESLRLLTQNHRTESASLVPIFYSLPLLTTLHGITGAEITDHRCASHSLTALAIRFPNQPDIAFWSALASACPNLNYLDFGTSGFESERMPPLELFGSLRHLETTSQLCCTAESVKALRDHRSLTHLKCDLILLDGAQGVRLARILARSNLRHLCMHVQSVEFLQHLADLVDKGASDCKLEFLEVSIWTWPGTPSYDVGASQFWALYDVLNPPCIEAEKDGGFSSSGDAASQSASLARGLHNGEYTHKVQCDKLERKTVVSSAFSSGCPSPKNTSNTAKIETSKSPSRNISAFEHPAAEFPVSDEAQATPTNANLTPKPKFSPKPRRCRIPHVLSLEFVREDKRSRTSVNGDILMLDYLRSFAEVDAKSLHAQDCKAARKYGGKSWK